MIVDYRARLKGDRWMVYDVYVEGVSLINNYKGQFNDIISKGSYEDLVAKLKDKLGMDDQPKSEME